MISSHILYHKWFSALTNQWPKQNKARFKVLAWLMVGLFLSGHVHLGKVARKLPGKSLNKSKERRLSRLLNNAKLPVRLIYRPIAEQLIAEVIRHGQPIRLIIDGSKIGNGHQLLMISLAYRRRSFPIIWTWRKGVKGHSPVYVQMALFSAVRLLIPEDATVIITGDSEFGSSLLMRRFEKWGWFYALRQKGQYLFSEDNAQTWQRCDSPSKKGKSYWFKGIALTQKHKYHCNLMVHWQKNCSEPWLIATNLQTAKETHKHYSWRMWIEALFGDCKSNGFDIEMTQLQTPTALNRLMLAIALLVVWLLAFGSRVVKQGQRHLVDRSDRRDLSFFRIGWDMIERCLANQTSYRVHFRPVFRKVSGG